MTALLLVRLQIDLTDVPWLRNGIVAAAEVLVLIFFLLSL
jgi:hypothetical protein